LAGRAKTRGCALLPPLHVHIKTRNPGSPGTPQKTVHPANRPYAHRKGHPVARPPDTAPAAHAGSPGMLELGPLAGQSEEAQPHTTAPPGPASTSPRCRWGAPGGQRHPRGCPCGLWRQGSEQRILLQRRMQRLAGQRPPCAPRRQRSALRPPAALGAATAAACARGRGPAGNGDTAVAHTWGISCLLPQFARPCTHAWGRRCAPLPRTDHPRCAMSCGRSPAAADAAAAPAPPFSRTLAVRMRATRSTATRCPS
jgi:hypothetical protein